MATVPLSGTNVRLLSGVPFYNDYKDTRWFDTKAAQTAYFLNRACPKSMQQATFQRFEDKTYISVSAEDKEAAEKVEAEIRKSAEAYLK